MATEGGLVLEENLVSYNLGGLGLEYEMLIVILQTHSTPLSLEEVKQHFLCNENHLEVHNCAGVMDFELNLVSSDVNLVGPNLLHKKIHDLPLGSVSNYTSVFNATQEHFLVNKNPLNDIPFCYRLNLLPL